MEILAAIIIFSTLGFLLWAGIRLKQIYDKEPGNKKKALDEPFK